MSRDGRLHGDIGKIRSYVLGIGYNKEELMKAKSILEKSLSARRSDKKLYPQGLDDGHKKRINSEQELLNRVNQMLRKAR